MEKTFTLTLTEKEGDLLLAGLAELPAKRVFDMIIKIKQEASSQLMPKTKAVEETQN